MAPVQKPGRSKQDYTTPVGFIPAVERLLGIKYFDWDLAASRDNSVAGLWYYGIEDNALAQPWKKGEGWNWLNPPFGHLKLWVKKAYDEAHQFGARTAMLVPASVGANWWRDWVHRKAVVYLMNGRLVFGGETKPYPKDCCLLLYGSDSRNDYHVWSWHEGRLK